MMGAVPPETRNTNMKYLTLSMAHLFLFSAGGLALVENITYEIQVLFFVLITLAFLSMVVTGILMNRKPKQR
jgi:hypothetical protein